MSANSSPQKRNRSKNIKPFFDKLPEDVKEYFCDVSKLLEHKFDRSVILAYIFFMIEKGQVELLCMGARKFHKTDIDMTRSAIYNFHITRTDFPVFFKKIYDIDIPVEILGKIKSAEKIRDSIMHGNDSVKLGAKKSQAIIDALTYAKEMNDFFIRKNIGIVPYGENKGYTGRGESHEKKTTQWILKGMGFISNKK